MKNSKRASSRSLRPPRTDVPPPGVARRILILAPTGNDATLTADFLSQANLAAHICQDVAELHAEVGRGCGAILLAEETLAGASISTLVETLAQQPAWSDIPVAIITSGGEASKARLRRLAIFGPTGNVTLLERPFRPGTLVSALEVALRARERQYEVQKLVQRTEQLMREREAQAQLFDSMLSSIADLAYTFDLEGNWIYANKPLLKIWGRSLAEITGKSSLELGYPRELALRLKRQVKEVVATRKPFRGETYFTDAAGVEDYHEYIFSPVFAPDGTVTAVTGTTRLTTERKRAEAVAESQRRVLQLMAEDQPLSEVLGALMRSVELQCSTKTFASVLLLDADGIHLRDGAAPSLPLAYRKAMDGVTIGPAVGSCGTAAFTKKPVYVSNIATDPLWKNYKHIALANGLRACWSLPILSTRGDVLGTFALYHLEPREANRHDLQVVETAVRTAGIAIERKSSDAAIRESQQRYSQLVQGLPTAVYTTDAEGRVILFNEAATFLWGRTPEVGKDLWCGSYRMYRADGTPLPLDQSPTAITLREGRSVRGEEIIIERLDGTRRIVRPYPDPIRDASGRIVGAVNMLLDVTDSKRAEDASRQLAAIVQSSDDAIISKDLNGVITTWNRGAEKLFGYRAEEVIGKPVTILMPPARFDEEPDILDHIRRGEGLEHHETVRRRKDGSDVEVSLTVSPVKNDHGSIIGASKIVRDITQQKQAERELEQTHREVLAASRAKDDFLAALSHELRTPLNPVLLLASEAAKDPNLAPEVRAQFVTIRNNVEMEAHLIDDLLDVTRIAHGKLSLDMALVNIHTVLEESTAIVQSELDQKKLRLQRDFQAVQSTVRGDAIRLQQVFWNVLKNAVKFTPEQGTITIATRTRDSQTLEVTITDTGIGMTNDELARVFDAFAQGEHAGIGRPHRFGGLGLGLAISQKLVEAHAGSISASSKGRSHGSTFIVTLPLVSEPASAAERSEESAPTLPPRLQTHAEAIHVLLVEDHEPTRTALAQLLRRRHYQVKTASSLTEARVLAAQQPFHLLISDIGLPDGTGIELMQELRGCNADLRGIALTGYGMEEDIVRTRNAGFTSHLTKPIRVQSLEAALAATMK